MSNPLQALFFVMIILMSSLIANSSFINPKMAYAECTPASFNYTINDGTIKKICFDNQSGSIVIQINATNNGVLNFEIKRSFMDWRYVSCDDIPFIVLLDGQEFTQNTSETKTAHARTLTIPFKEGSKEIDIIGNPGVMKPDIKTGDECPPLEKAISSPRKQVANGISLDKVICSDGLVLLKRTHTNSIACVKPQTAQKLVERGWGSLIIPTGWFEFKVNIISHDDCALIPWIKEFVQTDNVHTLVQSMSNVTLIEEYFSNHEITPLQIKYLRSPPLGNPISVCGLPTFYFLVPQNETSKMMELGFKAIDENDVRGSLLTNKN